MLRTTFTTTLRTLLKYKSYSLINILGLSLGLCCAIGIFLFVNDEWSYDKFQTYGDRIFRVNTVTRFSGNENRYPTTTALLADAIRTDVPDAEKVARILSREASVQVTAAAANEKFREEHFLFADPEIFKVFTFEFLKGSPETALANPSQLVINRTMAVKYFGSVEDAVGKEMLIEERLPHTVSAVIEDYPEQSELQVDLISHFENFFNITDQGARDFLRRDWLYNPISTYVLLSAPEKSAATADRINELKKKYADERVIRGVTWELQPLFDIHLLSNFTFTNVNAGYQTLVILGGVGLLILIIACVNFINLSTVHSLRRAKEIGVRKVLGVGKRGLIMQFLGESMMLVTLSFLVALIILYFLLPVLNQLSAKHIQISVLAQPETWMTLFGLLLSTGLLAGLYPAFYITQFNPIKVLKGVVRPMREKFSLRFVLVVLQFSGALVLVIATLIMGQQMDYIRKKELGFQKEQMMTIPLFSDDPNSILGGGVDGPFRARMNAFEQEVGKNAMIEAVTVSSVLPGSGTVNALVKTDKLTEEDNVFMPAMAVDYDFLQTYKIDLLAGRAFSREFGTDHLQAFIINERAVGLLGWKSPAAAVGQNVEIMGKKGQVVGVVKDFHFEGLQQALRPLAMEVAASKFTVFSLRIATGTRPAEAVALVREEWNKLFPEKVFQFRFLDDQLQRNYDREERLGKLVSVFSVLSIFISALGLFGLAAYINHMRVKEVSLRKVLGATTGQVFVTLSSQFFRMALIAVVLAVPLAYLLSVRWLSDFAYRVSPGWLPFVSASLVLLMVVFFTTAFQTMKTSRTNPAEVLRNE